MDKENSESFSDENGEFNVNLQGEERAQTIIINSENNEQGPVMINDFTDNDDERGSIITEGEENNSNDFDEDFIVMEEMKEHYRNHYQNSLTLFTNSQNFSFNYIIDKWEIKHEPAQLIIQGAAGTGKSFLIDSLRGFLID